MRLPKHIHSGEEAALVAYLMSALGTRYECTAQSIFECMRQGDARGLLDAVLRVQAPSDGGEAAREFVLAVEYDGGRWHTASNADHDVEMSCPLTNRVGDSICA